MSGRKKRIRERFIWWHRMKGHEVLKGINLLSPSSVHKCMDCDLIWDRSYL